MRKIGTASEIIVARGDDEDGHLDQFLLAQSDHKFALKYYADGRMQIVSSWHEYLKLIVLFNCLAD